MERPPRLDAAALARLSDTELVARSQRGCAPSLDALLGRYRRFARAKSRGYFLVGADRDDVEQEAMIGLFKAARDFRPEHEVSFRAFAELCITRQIITAIKAAGRRKHQALNQYVSISAGAPDDDEAQRRGDELLQQRGATVDPADGLVADERLRALRQRMAEVLSRFEVDVLSLYVEGRSYQEIGDHLDRHAKSVDNALQRIKRKLELHLVERDDDDRAEDLALLAS